MSGIKFNLLRNTLLQTLFILLATASFLFPLNNIVRADEVVNQSEPIALKTISSACELDYPPFCIVRENGDVDGFSIEIFRAALRAMGYSPTFKTGPWSEVKALLEEGKIEALPLVGRTPEREKSFDFTFPYLTMHGAIVVRKDTNDIHGLDDLKNRKVAVMAGDNAEEFLRRTRPDLQLQTTPTFLVAFQKLVRGECDAVVIQRLVALRIISENRIANLTVINQPITGFRQDFCFAVKNGDKKTLELLNEGLSIVMADGTYQQLHAKWFASLELPDNRRIVIGGDHNYPPFEFIDEDGNAAGLNVDVTRAIGRAIGQDFAIRLGNWAEIVDDLENGKIDALQGMLYSTERDRKFDFSQPHTINHCVGVRRKGTGFDPRSAADLKGLKLVVQEGDIMHDYVLKNDLASSAYIVKTQEEALKLLAAGKFDLALTARLTATFLLARNNLQNLEVLSTAFISPEYGFAVKNNQKALLAKLSEGLKLIEENGEFRKIQKKWLGIETEPGANLKTTLRYLAMFGIPLFLALCVFFFWSWALRQQVAIRTEELKRSEAQFRALIEGAPYGIFVQTNQKFAYVNEVARQLFGAKVPEEVIGKPVLERFHEKNRPAIIERMRDLNEEKKNVPSIELILTRLDGQEVEVESSAVPAFYDGQNGALVYMRDITEQKRLSNQLRQAQKMEAIGLLAGGVAHDYNNMLSVIQGYAEMTLNHVSHDKRAVEYLEEVLKAARKSGEITGQLLAFARQQPISPKTFDLRTGIEDTIKMLRRLISEDIELLFDPGSTDCMVKLDPVQLDQILANLCVNARDAIAGTGKIKIEVSSVSLNSAQPANSEGIEPGRYALLCFTDNGCGMTKETIEKIFEPFYSTKALGKGTGLGLATVYGIIKQNNGYIHVTSQPGVGTTFKIHLPSAGISHEEILENTISHSARQGKGQTILIVEDDESILTLAQKIVELHGFKALATTSPDEAIEIVKLYNGDIALLLTDVVMPGMNGKDLSERIAGLKPDIKCLFMSGYTADVIANRGVIYDGINFISKPFSTRGLINKIHEVIGSN